MVKSNSSEMPLPLLQVLEEEYVAVHGALPSKYDPNPTRFAVAAQHSESGVPTSQGGGTEQKDGAEVSDQALESQKDSVRDPLSEFYQAVHLGPRRAALCLSGGGIRSATFCLGVIQSLAAHGLLGQIDYLSTVSGGGYIGSWLSAWIHRQGRETVLDALRDSAPVTREPAATEPRIVVQRKREPAEIVHLREFSNYLTPKVGLGSVDFWTLLAIYIRNLLLNWLVLLPALMLPLLLPRFYLALLDYSCHVKWQLLLAGGIFEAISVARLDWSQPSLNEFRSLEQRKQNDQGSFLRSTWAPLLASAVLLSAAWFGYSAEKEIAHLLAKFIFFQLGVSLAAWFCNVLANLWANRGAVRERFSTAEAAVVKKHLWHSTSKLVCRLLKELMFILPVAALNGLLMWRFATWQFIDPQSQVLRYACWAPALYLETFLLSGALLHGLVNAISNSDSDLEWTARSAAWAMLAALGWLCGCAVVFFGPMLVIWLSHHYPKSISAAGGASGLSGLIVALLGSSGGTPATAEDAAGNRRAEGVASTLASARAMLCKWALQLAVGAFVLFVMIVLTFASDWLMQTYPLQGLPTAQACGLKCPPQNSCDWFAKSLVGLQLFPTLTVWTLIFAATTFLFGLALNINKFSLHGLYRNRLIRAYLGASRPDRINSKSYVPFTGFDSEDNIRLCRLDRRKNWGQNPELDVLTMEAKPVVNLRPFHVINITLNLVAGKNLAWQERKAESFTATPLHCGCGTPAMGYRKTEDYAGGKDTWNRGWRKSMSLGGAMAISGAAASPNMGYSSSPTISFLMALFNVRLGAWFGNPGPAGSDLRRPWLSSYGRSAPLQANRPFVDEALGLTDDTHPYVYLSDGGHFENLGLYEMVRRRCRYIVVCDADADGSCGFENLGNAIRKIYIDLGVRIDFKTPLPIYPRQPKPTENDRRYWAIGDIFYQEADGAAENGMLLYVKPAVYGKEPADVCSYANEFQDFPHDTTLNQFFTESQFESYRALGFHAMESICEEASKGTITLEQLFKAAQDYRPPQSP